MNRFLLFDIFKTIKKTLDKIFLYREVIWKSDNPNIFLTVKVIFKCFHDKTPLFVVV